MAKAGADVLIPHMGLTTKGSIGAKTALTLEEAAQRVQAMHDAAKSVKPDILVLCHGGPIAEPEDAAVHPRAHARRRRLLRRVEHRTAADRRSRSPNACGGSRGFDRSKFSRDAQSAMQPIRSLSLSRRG